MKRHLGGVYRAVRKVTGNPGLVLPRKKPLSTVPNVSGEQFAFIAGLHRSGTSVLHRLLREHSDTSGFANTRVPEDEGQFLQTVFERDTVFGGPGRIAFDDRAHLTEESPLITPQNREKLLRQWGPYFDLDRKILLEKTPSNLIRARFLQAMLPGARFIFIVRHPIAVGLSTFAWTRRSGIGLPEVMRHWIKAHQIFLDDLSHIQNWTFLRYEELVADPASVLANLHQFLGLDPVLPKEGVGKRNEKYFDLWESGVTERDRIAEEIAEVGGAAVLAKFGYRLSPPYLDDLPDQGDFSEIAEAKRA